MGHEFSGHIEGGKLDAQLIVLDDFKNPRGNTLCGFPLVVAGEHAVDIRFINGPEALLAVDGIGVGGGNNENAVSLADTALRLQLLHGLDQLRADIQLLNFIAAHIADDACGFAAAAKFKAADGKGRTI